MATTMRSSARYAPSSSSVSGERSASGGLQESACAVFDIGETHIRAGLAGEESPRCILPIPQAHGSTAVLVESDQERIKRFTDEGSDLEDCIELSIRKAINQFLYLSLRGKRVVLVERHLVSLAQKRMLARVLFTYHQPKEITFLHSAVCSTLAIGVSSGIVIDIGTAETTIIPVYENRPLNVMVQSTRLAGACIADRTRHLLKHFSTPRLETLSCTDVVNFMECALVCLPTSPLQHKLADPATNDKLQELYNLAEYRGKTFTWQQPSSGTTAELPVWTRFAIPEVLFEAQSIYVDSAYRSISACVGTIIKNATLDQSSALRQLIVTGAASAIPGLQHRIVQETGVPILENIYGANLAWTGASLATSLGYHGPILTVQQFITNRHVPDWTISSAHK